MSKVISARICARRDTTANWIAHATVVPLLGEIIVYTDYKTVTKDGVTQYIPGVKIGDGNAFVVDLPFVTDAVEAASILAELEAHINDTNVHTSAEEKNTWNSKISAEISGETLIFT